MEETDVGSKHTIEFFFLSINIIKLNELFASYLVLA